MSDLDATLPVAEVFGPTIQGEGPYCGVSAYFIRFGFCNLTCSWCDTPYTWDTTRFDLTETCPGRSVRDLVTGVGDNPTRVVVVTGGEPLILQRRPGFATLISALSKTRDVHVETNGTITPSDVVTEETAWFSVSPKLTNSGVVAGKRIKPETLYWFARHTATGRVGFKFVCRTERDVDEVHDFVTEFRIPPESVWIMPEGQTPQDVLTHHRLIIPRAVRYGYNTTTRLHTLLWNNDRGH